MTSLRRIGIATLACASLVGCRESHLPDHATDDEFVDTFPSLLIMNPGVLGALEQQGLSFARVVGSSSGAADAHEQSPLYAVMSKTLDADLRELERRLTRDERRSIRLFDITWIRSVRSHFELVGVVNRIDLGILDCGETRLIYRLVYQPPSRPYQRLPMTINAVFENRDPDCAGLASSWLALSNGPDLAQSSLVGPLKRLASAVPDRIEVNFQSMRENSTGPNTDDHAEYILRSFRIVDGRMIVDTLRNTPNPAMGAAEKSQLRDWIVANVDSIDAGSAELPHVFLARSSVSVTPRALDRPRNHPFQSLFRDGRDDFLGLELTRRQIAVSPAMLVRRLDEMSCAGCHQSRSIAGFHLLGEDRARQIFNAFTLGISPYLHDVLAWRYGVLKAISRKEPPPKIAPLPEHISDEGQYGEHCTTSDQKSDMPLWRCASGLTCIPSAVDGQPVGVCVATGARRVGDSCQNVQLGPDLGLDGDRVVPQPALPCSMGERATGRCDVNGQGFPGGMCTATCFVEGEQTPKTVCVRIPHFGFERSCLLPGVLIEECIRDPRNSVLDELRRCSRTEACRDDFVCGRVEGLPPDQGACVPPYFLFQTRVDGAPVDR